MYLSFGTILCTQLKHNTKVFKASPNRFLCFFFDGKKIIISSAYKKQSTKIPAKEKQKALKAKKDYEKRYKAGNYYE